MTWVIKLSKWKICRFTVCRKMTIREVDHMDIDHATTVWWNCHYIVTCTIYIYGNIMVTMALIKEIYNTKKSTHMVLVWQSLGSIPSRSWTCSDGIGTKCGCDPLSADSSGCWRWMAPRWCCTLCLQWADWNTREAKHITITVTYN